MQKNTSKSTAVYKNIIIGALIVLGVLYANANMLPKFLAYNRTDSIPIGLYLGDKTRPLNLSKGSIACFRYIAQDWAKNRNYLPENYVVCKRILGKEGDLVQFDKTKVVVTDKVSGVSSEFARSAQDSKNRPLPNFEKAQEVIPEGFLFMAGDSVKSLDSRYIGLVPASSLMYTITPVFIAK